MPLLYEPGISFQINNVRGWTRTVILALGSAAGVITTAGLIHLAKKGKPERGPRGWPRTVTLALGGFAGTMLTATGIHLVKQRIAVKEI